MFRKLLLIAIAIAWLLPVAAVAGQPSFDGPEQHTQSKLSQEHHNGGISPEVLAALIAGGLGLCGVVITVALGRRKSG